MKTRISVIIAVVIFAAVSSVFAQVDVARQTIAVTYPQDEQVHVEFRGTTRFPRMSGNAKVRRSKRNGTEVELAVSKMPRPFELGAGYATYVLWAISPDGQIDNLGEIKRRGFWEFDSKITVTTPLQTFALIVTAEPHFLVKRPSQAIMLENVSSRTTSGRVVPNVKNVQYFGNSSDFFRDARTPEIAETNYSKTPPTILQAKQAVALAKYAGAERDATAEYNDALTLLQNAENAWKAERADDEIDIAARKAISVAVKAEETALVRREAREKRNEKSRQDEEIRRAEDKYQEAQDQITDLKAELAREIRNRELAERDAGNFGAILKDMREENGKLREEVGRLRIEIEAAKLKVEKTEADRQAEADSRAKQDKQMRIEAEVPFLMQALKSVGTVSRDARGVVVALPETIWSGVRVSSFAPSSDTRLRQLANVLANYQDYRASVESHSDDKGSPDEIQLLTQERAQAMVDKLVSFGVSDSRLEAKGYGAGYPKVANTTNANRAKNRRVEVVLTITQ